MAKLNLSDPVNLRNEQTALGTLAANNRAIEQAIEKSLSRDGTSPNEMNSDFDMNSHRIINLPDAVSATEPVPKRQVQPLVDAAAATIARGPQGLPGNATGPGSSVDGEIVLFNGTTGALLKRATGTGWVKATNGVYSVVTTITIADVTGLQTALNGKVNKAGDTMTGVLINTLGDSVSRIDYQQWKPSDWGTGKPYIAITKGAAAQTWEIVPWDGTVTNGTINLISSSLLANGNQVWHVGNLSQPAQLNVEAQQLAGGARITEKDLGTISSGTVTPDPGARPLQKYTNGGAHTLTPGSNVGSYLLTIINSGTPGAITTTGWTKVAGDPFTVTAGHKFRCHVSVTGDGSLLIVQALQ
jgi:hypothetical protein